MGRLLRQVLAPGETQRRTVKSCGPGAATLASIPACLCGPGNGGKKGRSPGRARNKPPNHCAGKAGMSWLYLSNPCAPSYYPLHTAMRVPPAPGLLRALYTRGSTKLQSSGENRAVRAMMHVYSSRVPGAVQRASGAPQNRDPHFLSSPASGPRLGSAPRYRSIALRCIRGARPRAAPRHKSTAFPAWRYRFPPGLLTAASHLIVSLEPIARQAATDRGSETMAGAVSKHERSR